MVLDLQLKEMTVEVMERQNVQNLAGKEIFQTRLSLQLQN